MSLTLELLQIETNFRFREVYKRFDEVDRRFDEIDKRFEAIAKRFDEIDKRSIKIDQRFDQMDQKINNLAHDVAMALSPYFVGLEKILNNHEERISALEKKH